MRFDFFLRLTTIYIILISKSFIFSPRLPNAPPLAKLTLMPFLPYPLRGGWSAGPLFFVFFFRNLASSPHNGPEDGGGGGPAPPRGGPVCGKNFFKFKKKRGKKVFP